jgi:hypothetical protein
MASQRTGQAIGKMSTRVRDLKRERRTRVAQGGEAKELQERLCGSRLLAQRA